MINIRGIFVGSFVAMLATGAVAANNTPSIASKAYVKSQIQPVAAVADTAIQPGDNVSALTNDAGYLTQHQDISGKADASTVTALSNKVGTGTMTVNGGVQDTIVAAINALDTKTNGIATSESLGNLQSNVTSLATQVDTNTGAIATLNGGTNVSGSVDAKIAAATSDMETQTNAAATYLSKTDASNTYLTKTDAANTYLTEHQSLAAYDTAEQIAETYETKSNAASVYETKQHAAETYLTEHQSLAAYDTAEQIAETYLTKNDAANTYLTKTDAANTYLTEHQDISGKADVATVTALSNTVDGISNKIGTGTMTVNGGTQETVIAAINALDTKTNGIATSESLGNLQSNVTSLATQVDTNTGAIATLNGGTNVSGSVDAKIAAATSDMETQTNAAATYLSKTDAATTYATISDMNGKQPTISDLTAIRDGAALGATALQKNDVTTGGENGTIAVDGTDVAVRGLGTAAFTNATAYVTVPAASGNGGKQVLTYDGDTGTYYWESIGR